MGGMEYVLGIIDGAAMGCEISSHILLGFITLPLKFVLNNDADTSHFSFSRSY